MERPTSVNGLELIRILELMGLTLHSQLGPFCVFLNQNPGERIVFMTTGWDLPISDIERTLHHNGLDVARFWECHETLYQN